VCCEAVDGAWREADGGRACKFSAVRSFSALPNAGRRGRLAQARASSALWHTRARRTHAVHEAARPQRRCALRLQSRRTRVREALGFQARQPRAPPLAQPNNPTRAAPKGTKWRACFHPTTPHPASSSTWDALSQLTQARQMGNRAQFKPTIGDNAMGFPKTVWCVAEVVPVPAHWSYILLNPSVSPLRTGKTRGHLPT